MQEKHLFEYAVIRLVPRVEREEFFNVGVIVYCPSHQFLKTLISVDENRLNAFSSDLDIQEVHKNLAVFDCICKGGKEGGAIGMLPIASRFRWLTATRSTIVQTSMVHLGLCKDPGETLTRLFNTLVK